MRRTQINSDLNLHDNFAYTGASFMADVWVTNAVHVGSKVQVMSRNSQWDLWNGDSWNSVFTGCLKTPAQSCDQRNHKSSTVVHSTPLIAEKPYISEINGAYKLNIPHVEVQKYGLTPGFVKSTQVDFS